MSILILNFPFHFVCKKQRLRPFLAFGHFGPSCLWPGQFCPTICGQCSLAKCWCMSWWSPGGWYPKPEKVEARRVGPKAGGPKGGVGGGERMWERGKFSFLSTAGNFLSFFSLWGTIQGHGPPKMRVWGSGSVTPTTWTRRHTTHLTQNKRT